MGGVGGSGSIGSGVKGSGSIGSGSWGVGGGIAIIVTGVSLVVVSYLDGIPPWTGVYI